MLRTIDHAGYYETRIILMALSLAIAAYYLYYHRDRRYLIMFVSGSVFAIVTEYFLQFRGLRGPGYSFSIFDLTMTGIIGNVVQGTLEGGTQSLFAFWFTDLRLSQARWQRWSGFFLLCVIVVLLAFIAGMLSRHRAISSTRPMFAIASIALFTAVIFVSLVIAWRQDALSQLANFFGGLLLFAFLNFEPLQLTGSRYIGVSFGPETVPVSMPLQILMMLLSNVFESAGSKLHYLSIPLFLKMVTLEWREDEGSGVPYSIQQLQDLVQRGLRKRTKPF